MSTEKVRYDRLRRVAERRGFKLTKPRRYDRRAKDYAVYVLHDLQTGYLWGRDYRFDLDRVEIVMDWDEERRRAWYRHHNS
jgi:hypothetical protein